jgi:Na+:H+ antiporter, NhaA family
MESRRDEPPILPEKPIDRVLSPLVHFLHIEAMGGIVLIAASVAALVLANSRASDAFLAFWKTPIGIQIGTFEFRHSLRHFIDDGLMVIFFFVIGLEVKRELVLGELRGLRQAALPIVGAIGGIVVPAGIYLMIEGGKSAARGWGIPMATDIAFVVGCMAILGSRIPRGLRMLLLSLAIVDDIGAILVVAIGYSRGLNFVWLGAAILGLTVVFTLGWLGVRSFFVYGICSVAIWFAFHESGIHATIAGVILGLMTPARSQINEAGAARILKRSKALIQNLDWRTESNRAGALRAHQTVSRELVSPLEYLMDVLHPWVSFVIMPLFAFANAGVRIRTGDMASPAALAIVCALCLGKPLGISLSIFFTVKLGLSELPAGVSWPQILGGGMLGGIGFTMALFIAALALDGDLLNEAKVGVLMASLISAVLGIAMLLPASGSGAKHFEPDTVGSSAGGQADGGET